MISHFEIGKKEENSRHASPKNIDFFMDTGNDGISVHDVVFRDYLSKVTSGFWKESEDDLNDYGVDKLVVPLQRANAPDLTLIFENNLPVTLPGWAWLFEPPKKYSVRDSFIRGGQGETPTKLQICL